MTNKPEPSAINSWQAAEANAAAWMRYWGFADARVTNSGSDAGIDIRATRALAQVKREAKAVGRPIVQNLVGARGWDASLQLFFFSLSGYTQTALDYARQLEIALFQYDSSGAMTGVNARARRIIEEARGREIAPNIEDAGPSAEVRPMFEDDEIEVFYYRSTIGDCARALYKMHRMGGGEGRAVSKAMKTTIAPGWLKEYAGLVSLTAEKGTVWSGDERIVWVKWSSYSNATPETIKRVTADAEAAMERAVKIFSQLVGKPVAAPEASKALNTSEKTRGVASPTRKRSTGPSVGDRYVERILVRSNSAETDRPTMGDRYAESLRKGKDKGKKSWWRR